MIIKLLSKSQIIKTKLIEITANIGDFIVSLIELLVGLIRTWVLVVISLTLCMIWLEGIEYVLSFDGEIISEYLLNMLVISAVLEVSWPMVRRSFKKDYYRPVSFAASGATLSEIVLKNGRRIVDEETHKKQCIPWLSEKEELEAFIDDLRDLESSSQIHDAKFNKLMGQPNKVAVTESEAFAKEGLKYRFGGVVSDLYWDADIKLSDDGMHECTLKVKSDLGDVFTPTEYGRSKYAPAAILVALVHREIRMWKTCNH